MVIFHVLVVACIQHMWGEYGESMECLESGFCTYTLLALPA